jgi:hypothetical protein
MAPLLFKEGKISALLKEGWLWEIKNNKQSIKVLF